MNTHLLNRAVLNRNALDDDQRKAMFARLGGHGGGTSYGGSARKAADAGHKERMAKALKMGFGLGLSMIGGIGVAGEAKAATPLAKSLQNILSKARAQLTGARGNGMIHPELKALNELSYGAMDLKEAAIREHGFVDEATSSALRTLRTEENAIRMGSKADQAADDLWAHSAPAEGGPDPFARAVRDARDRVAARLRADRAALRKPASVAESSGRYTPADQARRNELATQLRRDRELKRLDQHPEKFFGNRMPPARSDEERRRRAFFASKGDGYVIRARGLMDHASTVARKAISATSGSVVLGPNERTPQPVNGFLDWALREQRPGGPVIQDNPRNPYDTPEQWAQNLRAQYEEWLQQNPGTTLPVSRSIELPVAGSRQTVQAIPDPSPQPPQQRPAPPGGASMPIGGPAPVYGEPGTRPIPRTPPDPTMRIGGPAPVRRNDTPASTAKATASTLQRAVDQFRTW